MKTLALTTTPGPNWALATGQPQRRACLSRSKDARSASLLSLVRKADVRTVRGFALLQQPRNVSRVTSGALPNCVRTCLAIPPTAAGIGILHRLDTGSKHFRRPNDWARQSEHPSLPAWQLPQRECLTVWPCRRRCRLFRLWLAGTQHLRVQLQTMPVYPCNDLRHTRPLD